MILEHLYFCCYAGAEQRDYFAELNSEMEGFKKLIKERDRMVHLQTWKNMYVTCLSEQQTQTTVQFVHSPSGNNDSVNNRGFPRIQIVSSRGIVFAWVSTASGDTYDLRLCSFELDWGREEELHRSGEFADEWTSEEADGAYVSNLRISDFIDRNYEIERHERPQIEVDGTSTQLSSYADSVVAIG